MRWIDSMLNPVTTLQLFFLQVLYGNTACQHLSHLSGLPLTAAAYCVARGRIALGALELLLSRSIDQQHAVAPISTCREFASGRPARRAPSAWCDANSSEDDCRLYTRATARHAGQRQIKEQKRIASFALDAKSWPLRSDRAMAQADVATALDDGRAVSIAAQ